MKIKKLSPEQNYLLYTHVEKNRDVLSNLTWVDAGREVRKELQFFISTSSVKRAMLYFGLQKDKHPIECFAASTLCKLNILTRHVAILYKEQLLPIPKELKKLL